MGAHYGAIVKSMFFGSKHEPPPVPPLECVQCLHVLNVKTNFLSEDNRVSVHFTEVNSCAAFVNNIPVDVLSQCAYCST